MNTLHAFGWGCPKGGANYKHRIRGSDCNAEKLEFGHRSLNLKSTKNNHPTGKTIPHPHTSFVDPNNRIWTYPRTRCAVSWKLVLQPQLYFLVVWWSLKSRFDLHSQPPHFGRYHPLGGPILHFLLRRYDCTQTVRKTCTIPLVRSKLTGRWANRPVAVRIFWPRN